MNVQVLADPVGRLIWALPALPGARHDMGAACEHGLIDELTTMGEHVPQCRVLILTGLGRPGMLRPALAARVDGFLLKDAPPDRLADAIRQVAGGRRIIDSELALAAWERGECPLSNRELDVLAAAARGVDVPDIAASLFLSPGTVRNYLGSAVTKLDARNRLDAVRIATDAGWLT